MKRAWLCAFAGVLLAMVACHDAPRPPDGLTLRLGSEARAIGSALATSGAPRLRAIGHRLAACAEGATVAAPRLDPDLLAGGITCQRHPPGISGTLVHDGDVWSIRSEGADLSVTPPDAWRPPASLRGIDAVGAWLGVRWWLPPEKLVAVFPPDIVPRALSLALTGELALAVMSPPHTERPPRLAFGLGLREGVSPSLVSKALEDAATRLGGRTQRESTPLGVRHCIPGLEIAEGFQPCAVVLNEGFVIVGMDAVALDAVTPDGALERGPPRLDFHADRLAAADEALGLPPLTLPLGGVRLEGHADRMTLRLR